MLQYTNGFSSAVDSKKEEVIINFTQQAPVFDAEGNVVEIQIENIIGLAMGKSMAENLVEVLNGLLSDLE